ncbi:MAG TPA: recombinase RecA [Candidatus Obscuribacter sp.]|nr:recombinase RecA [Candidatus Obscuribacter sp.]MBK9276831.1 recombinase RecA [Candidatus Obscuribacter sp.]MBL8081886.1 recombinase RecA [Candidatus Obscuribacter sp.]HMW89769.1 recombinase RecA [Candidatus Obscuribacter sp.]HMY04140.1 recombinase RecA [Candidatus Obscuribacter sp.]
MAVVTKEKTQVEKNTEKPSKASADKASKNEPTPSQERLKALGLALDSIKKQYGDGSIMKLGDSRHTSVEVVPTGALSLDVALGIGGLPRGRIIEIYGPESSGKTTLAQHVAAEVQKLGGIAAIVDAEHAMDPEYARALGVNVDELLISQPDTGEQALEITEQLVRSGAVDLVIVDSVAALVPKAEIEGEMGDSLPGLQARLMSQALRKLTAVVAKTHTIVIFINQLRQKIGVMYGNPETTTGGNALKFYASVRLDIRKIETLKKDGSEIGNRVKVKVVKNKVAPPFRIAEFDIIYGRGINSAGCLLDMAAEMDIVKKSGTWFSYKEDRIGQGRDQARNFLEANPDMLKEIEARVKAELTKGAVPADSKAEKAEKAANKDK